MSLSRLAAYLDTWSGDARARRFREGWPATSAPDVRFHDDGVIQYRYRDSGRGPAIVFTADPPVTLEAYDALIERLSDRFRVIVVELPAMGFSAARRRYGFGFAETNDSLAGFLEAVAGRGAVLGFSCAAGLAAVDIAHRRPELARALVLFQTTDWTGFQTWKAARDPKRVLGRPVLGQIAMRRLAASRAPAWFRIACGNETARDSLCACAVDGLERGAGWTLASAYQRYLAGDRDLPPAAQPTLVVWGKRDRSHGPEAAARARRLGTDVSLLEVEDAGHFPELEAPDRVAGAIADFLARRAA